MQIRWKTLCAVVTAVLVAGVAHAAGQPCPVGCAAQDLVCLKTARMSAASCRMDCRRSAAPADLGACMRGCTMTARGARATCSSDARSCVAACNMESSAGAFVGDGSTASCLGGCGADLGACARNVAAGIHTCVTGCRTSSDHAGCLGDCASAAQSGAATCASDFQSCTSGCGSTSTTPVGPPATIPGPPTTTSTLPDAAGCGMRDDQVCGGRCPDPRDVCQSVSGGCTCMPR